MNRRANNFTTKEVEKLLDLVEEKKVIIENKQTDRVSSTQKDDAWKTIEISFNAVFENSYRSAKHLKIKYENVKRNAKQKNAASRAELYKTGGGVLTVPPASTLEDKVMAICQKEQIQGNASAYDSDKLMDTSLIDILDEVEVWPGGNENCASTVGVEKEDTADDNNNAKTSSWAQWQPHMLKEKPHNLLTIKKKPKLNKNAPWNEVAELKKEKIILEMTLLKERHELETQKIRAEIEHQKELHDLKVSH